MSEERMTDAELIEAASKLSADPEEAGKHLSEAERAEYRRCQESIVEARNAAWRAANNRCPNCGYPCPTCGVHLPGQFPVPQESR
jgi:hypothetical protein